MSTNSEKCSNCGRWIEPPLDKEIAKIRHNKLCPIKNADTNENFYCDTNKFYRNDENGI